MMESNKFEEIFRAIILPCLVLKPERDTFLIEDANNSYLEQTETNIEELLGRTANETFSHLKYCEADLLLQSLHKTVTTKKIDCIEELRFNMPIDDKENFLEKYWNLINIPVVNSSGQVEIILHTIQDITLQVLSDKEKKRTKDELAKNKQQYLSANLEKIDAEAAVKQREEALRRSEQKFKALVQEGSDLLGILSPNGEYLFASDTTTSILGVPPEYFLGKNAFDFIHPDDKEPIGQEFNSLKNKKRIKVGPYRFQDGDGNWRWIETTATNLLDDPAVQGIVANSRDITILLNQAYEIEEINERYRLAATATKDLMYDWDITNDEVLRFHRSNEDIFGHKISEVEKRDYWRSHIHPEDLEEVKEIQKKAFRDKKQDFIKTEYRFRRKDGSYAFISDRAFIIRDADGKPTRMVGASSDISEMKSKEEALSLANRRYRLAMEAAKEMIWDWDVVEDKVERSKAFQLFRFRKEDNYQRADFWFSQVVKEDRERVQKSLSQALEDPETTKWKEEYRLKKPGEETAYIHDRGSIIRDETGRAVRMVGSALDVTESRKAMKRIKQQNELLRDIAWDQSHLVRGPLVRIKGLLNLFTLDDFNQMDHKEIRSHLYASVDELDEMVKSIVKKTEKVKDL